MEPLHRERIPRRTLLKRLAATAVGAAATTLLPKWGSSPASAAGLRPAHALSKRDADTLAAIAYGFMRQYGAPGLSIAIARHGAFLYQQGFGYADNKQKVTPQHLFRIASVTKPFTSATLFALIEKGVLRLDDGVFGPRGHLKDDFGSRYPAVVNQITVHHLLTHTSGGWGNTTNDPMFSNPGLNQRQLIAWTLQNRPLEYAPGSHYDYSNFGYCVLGRLIEKLMGQPYAAAVQQHVLSRCGITTMRMGQNGRAAGEVLYYGRDGQNPYGFNIARLDSHGGWIATASDLVNFVARVDGFASPPDIIGRGSLQKMVTPTLPNPAYACGWGVNEAPNWWHLGSLPGTSSVMLRSSNGFCWAALANTRSEGSGAALDQMMWQMAQSVPGWWK